MSDPVEAARQVLAVALERAQSQDHTMGLTYWPDIIISVLDDNGYAIRSESAGTGLHRVVPGPSGSCHWDAHHWVKDRWEQTICAACNARIEPIESAGTGLDREGIATLTKALRIGASSFDADPWFAEHDGIVKNRNEGEAAIAAAFIVLDRLSSADTER